MNHVLKRSLLVAAAVAALVSGTAFAAGREEETPFTTPPGLMLVDVTKFLGNASNQYLWRHIADAAGKPLYTFNDEEKAGGKPSCVDECLKEFIPYQAPRGAVAFGDWGIVTRPDNTRQWAYQGLPLYTFNGKDPRGEPSQGGLSTTGAENPANFDPGSKLYSPKEGWKRAAYRPERSMALPAGIELQSLAVANGYALQNASSKKTIYTLRTPPGPNSELWTPVYAPSLALPLGDFRVLQREDGTRQWAYKDKALYTYEGDYAPDDVGGIAEKGAEVALASKHFAPKEVAVRIVPGRGPLLVTAKGGLSTYTLSRQHLQYGSRQVRGGYRYSYMDGKAVGTRGCDTAECRAMYKPVVAPKDAQSWGLWEVMIREDGTRQWAYRGSALYTYVGDKKPGDILGNNRHIIMFGDKDGTVDLSASGGDDPDGKYASGSGLYWHLTGLHY
jgi:predicted lipoprotein with Yx(FWY)xxD motif